jgi:aerobic carbon-monoxide dehydrogenase large subunit
VINPAVVEGQIRGWVALGMGAVVLERSVYVDNGQFLTGSFMDYLLPTATDIPRIDVEHVQAILLDPDINFRGVGEGGMIVAPRRCAMPSRTHSPRTASASTSSTSRRPGHSS